MPRLQILALVLFTTACSGSDDKPEPCSLSHRNRTYLIHYAEHAGGTCGPITDSVTSPGEAMEVATGCQLDSPDDISADQCSVTRNFRCVVEGVPGYGTFVGISTEHDGGASLSGTATVRLFYADGSIKCLSTYDVTWEAQ